MKEVRTRAYGERVLTLNAADRADVCCDQSILLLHVVIPTRRLISSLEGGSKMSTWIDVLTLVLSGFALIVSLWTQYQDRKWKAEVEGRRPFAAEVQKLSLISAQYKLSAARCASLFKQLQLKINALEKRYGRRADLDSLRQSLNEEEAELEENRRSAADSQQTIDLLWKVASPSSEDFARVQQMHAQLSIALTAIETQEENLRERLYNLSSG
jgi:hypothetical protein